MTLIERIKEDNLAARKNRDQVRATLLTTLFSEAVSVGKNAGNRETTDAETLAVIKKFIKGIDDTLSAMKDKTDIAEYIRQKLEEVGISVNLLDDNGVGIIEQTPEEVTETLNQRLASINLYNTVVSIRTAQPLRPQPSYLIRAT